MANRKNRRKTGGAGQGSGSGSPTTPTTLGKRPLSDNTPDGFQNADSKRQREGSNDSVFESVGENSGGAGIEVTMEDDGTASERLDRERLTKQLLDELDKAIRNGSLGIEGGGEAMGAVSVVMNSFVHKVLPVFLNFVLDKVLAVFGQQVTQPATQIPPVSADRTSSGVGDVQTLCTRLKYENDGLEQYSRRESIRIFGIPEHPDEDNKTLEAKVLKVMNDTGANITAQDISVMHRIGKKGRISQPTDQVQGQGQSQTQGQGQDDSPDQGQGGGENLEQGQQTSQQGVRGSRPVIVRFISRAKKMEVMTLKKTLKNKDGYKDIFMHEDITRLRSKLLHYVKSLPYIGRTWTKDGLIYCKRKGPNNTLVGDVIGPIENADSLFQFFGVNLSPEIVKDLGLDGYVFVQ